jgi:two-component system, NarL family, invasion response regulator UvrY
MPGLSGLDILRRLSLIKSDTRILMVSFHPEEQYAVRAFNLGASGYLSKECTYEELSTAIHKIASGGKYVSSNFAEKLIFSDNVKGVKNLHDSLSDREFQVMVMLSQGRSLIDIARDLFISDKTVSTYRLRILKKMGMKRNADLTFYAIRNNLSE